VFQWGPRWCWSLCRDFWLRARPVSYQLFWHSDSLLEAYKCSMKTHQGKTIKCISSWKKLLSLEGRLILINSILNNMILYIISFFMFSKGVLQWLDYFELRYFWQGHSENKIIGCLNEMLLVTQKIKKNLIFMTLRPRMELP
jgi:hypothetical protein